MLIFLGIFFLVENAIFIDCANREMRIEMTPCPNVDQLPAHFNGQFVSIGEKKFAVNGTLIIDRDIGFNSTLEVSMRFAPQRSTANKIPNLNVFSSFFFSFRFNRKYNVEVSKCKMDMSHCEDQDSFPGPNLCEMFSKSVSVYNTLITKSVPELTCPMKAVRYHTVSQIICTYYIFSFL